MTPKNDPNIFNVYIDEAGDEGFTIKDGKWVSTQWFIVGAMVVRSTNDLTVSQNINIIKDRLTVQKNAALHFTKLSHEKRKFTIATIAKTGLIRCIYVGMNKISLGDDSPLKKKGLLYNYCTRYLLERITWLVHEQHGKANLIFENRSNTSYDELGCYINEIINYPNNQVRQDVIKSYRPLNKGQSKNLQVADAITSSLFQALELSTLGQHESSYIETLRPYIYNRSGNYGSYGLKLFPIPFGSATLIQDYPWMKTFLE